jgi:predicted nucleotidyltransferase
MFEELLEKLARELGKKKIPYMIIGGQAVLAYGEPRLTRDIDLTLGWDADRAEDIMALAETLGWKVLSERPREFARETMVLPCQDPDSGIRIDFIFSFSPYEAEAIRRVKRLKIRQTEVCFASVEDLIIHKMVAGRARDWEDVRNVLLRNPVLDQAYIGRWLTDFQSALEKPLIEKFKELQTHSS